MSASTLSDWSTATNRCSTSSIVLPSVATSWRAGPSVYAAASRPAAPSSVAEKNIVWRCFGSRRTIRSTWGWNPMSSMRSASSRTSIRMPPSFTEPRVARSSSRPGVAINTSALRARSACGPILAPPYTGATVRPLAFAMSRSSSVTCTHSSRVGTRTRADAPSVGETRSTIGIENASVLPEPVRDLARTSRPSSASRITSAWIGKGASIPRLARIEATASDTPSVWNEGTAVTCAPSAAVQPPVIGRGREHPETAVKEGPRNETSRDGVAVPRQPLYQGTYPAARRMSRIIA
jgi:hypothetical protein